MPEGNRLLTGGERAAWIVVVLLLIVAWFVKSNQTGDLRSDLRYMRNALDNERARAERLEATITEREGRFPTMGAACARLVNAYAQDAATLQEVVGDFVNGRTAKALDRYEGYARGQVDADFFNRQDRELCGLRSVKSWYDEVRQVRQAWTDGVEPPDF